eukprot:CAMPEP_0167806452 /NCGR_PEP_ID=MMETSP0111_2-20121227/21850_1 /TAXON_ID=91324 /ORGANISM="Lotharella globosa, Strain CCCM811" /LENGTH=247 /DNA_ID=CAMNT_0007703935 /DNA_START=298 /DNA_END=1041 /DNA_ORIENTATION=+
MRCNNERKEEQFKYHPGASGAVASELATASTTAAYASDTDHNLNTKDRHTQQGSKASLPQTPQAVAAETPAIQTGGRIQVSVVSESSSSRQPSSVSSQLKRNEKAAIAWAAKAWHTAMKTRKRVMKRPHHSALRAYHVAKKLATIPTQPSHVKTDMHVADRKSPCRPPRQTGSLGKREKIGWACLSDIPDPGPSTAPLPCKVVECDASVNIRDAEEQAARAKALASVMAARNRKKKQQQPVVDDFHR